MKIFLAAALVLIACSTRKAPDSPAKEGAGLEGVSAVPLDAGEVARTVQGAPAAGEAPHAVVYVVKDNKVRCIKAPCMSLDAFPVASSEPTEKISDLDLSSAGLTHEQEQQAMAQLYTLRGLKVEGQIEEREAPRGGTARVLKATRVLPR